MKKNCLKKVVKKVKEIIKPSKKVVPMERRKADRRKADRRWMSKISNDPNYFINRNGDRRIGDRRKK